MKIVSKQYRYLLKYQNCQGVFNSSKVSEYAIIFQLISIKKNELDKMVITDMDHDCLIKPSNNNMFKSGPIFSAQDTSALEAKYGLYKSSSKLCLRLLKVFCSFFLVSYLV